MLTFFRRIRKGLLEGGRTSKYLLYAIGEIALVVVGILIALQINNWNEWRKDRELEHKILQSLVVDFQKNIDNLQGATEYNERFDKILTSSINYIGTPHSELSEAEKDTLRSSGSPITEIVEGTLNSVLNSDKLELLSNDSLKNMLTSYPAMVQRFKRQEETSRFVLHNRLRPILESYISLSDDLSQDQGKFPNLKERAIPSDFEGLLKSHTYQNSLVDHYWIHGSLARRTIDLSKSTEEIVEIIQSELMKFTH